MYAGFVCVLSTFISYPFPSPYFSAFSILTYPLPSILISSAGSWNGEADEPALNSIQLCSVSSVAVSFANIPSFRYRSLGWNVTVFFGPAPRQPKLSPNSHI